MKPILSPSLNAALQVMRRLHCPPSTETQQKLRAGYMSDGLQWELRNAEDEWVTMLVKCRGGVDSPLVVQITSSMPSYAQVRLFGHFEYRAAAHCMNEVAAQVLKGR